MALLLRCAFCATLVLLSALSGIPLAAQDRVARAPAELLAAYVQDRQALKSPSQATNQLTQTLRDHQDYPASYIESLLDGLERIALTGSPSWVRAEAVLRLSLPGSNRVPTPVQGTFDRLERIYNGSNDSAVRSMVVSAMSDLADTQRAIPFLARVAAQEPVAFPEAPRRALTSLLRMGEKGRLAVKHLHESGEVRDPDGRLMLRYLAKHDFRPR